MCYSIDHHGKKGSAIRRKNIWNNHEKLSQINNISKISEQRCTRKRESKEDEPWIKVEGDY